MHSQLEPIVTETNANRARFEQFCRSLSAAELATVVPGSAWRTQDYIAHLATIDIWVGEWFEHQADGRPWRPRGPDGAPFNIDTWNETRIVERRNASLEDLLAEAAVHREKLWAAVDRFSPEVLAARFSFRGRDITFLRYMQLWVAHDPAHSADMVRALPRRAEDPSLREWFAKYSIPAPATTAQQA